MGFVKKNETCKVDQADLSLARLNEVGIIVFGLACWLCAQDQTKVVKENVGKELNLTKARLSI